jgi:hypothetical protein
MWSVDFFAHTPYPHPVQNSEKTLRNKGNLINHQ